MDDGILEHLRIGKIGAGIRAHPASDLARSANMFLKCMKSSEALLRTDEAWLGISKVESAFRKTLVRLRS